MTAPRPYSQAVSAHVRELVDRSGRILEEVADAAGIYRMVLRRRLSGHAAFQVDELDAVGHVLGISPLKLLLVDGA